MKGSIQGAARICVRTAMAVGALTLLSTVSRAQDSTATTAVDAAGNRTHIVRAGETLWDIAHTYLGDGDLWPEIIRINRHLVQDPHWIFPNEVLLVPPMPAGPSSAPATAVATAAPATPAAAAGAAPDTSGTAAASPADTTSAPSPSTAPTSVADQTPAATPAPETPADATAAADDAASSAPGATLFNHPPQAAAMFGTGRVGGYVRHRREGVGPGERNGAPYLDRDGGPRRAGAVVGVVDVSNIIDPANVAHYSLDQDLYITLPAGSQPVVGARFYTYALGDSFGDQGQIIVPTGIVTVIRPGEGHDATVARITQQFDYMQLAQGVLPVDQAPLPTGPAAPLTGGAQGHVVWVEHNQVLPTIGFYVVLDVPAKSNVQVGDRITLYRPRMTIPGTSVVLPESEIATAQVVRVTRYGVTGLIQSQIQPDIEPGVAGRVTARIQ